MVVPPTVHILSLLSLLIIQTTRTAPYAWVPSLSFGSRVSPSKRGTLRYSSLDITHPVVAEEYATTTEMSYDDMTDELNVNGIIPPESIDESQLRAMLVETRLRRDGRLSNARGLISWDTPRTFCSNLEEVLWTNHEFARYYRWFEDLRDTNKMNVMLESLAEPEIAKARYANSYPELLDEIDVILHGVRNPMLQFHGFPAKIKETGCKEIFESFGTLVEFECALVEDIEPPVIKGHVTYEDIESAQKVKSAYNGKKMGTTEPIVMTN